MEVLPHDVVEEILERVPVDSLVRLKCVSKQWKSTIESKCFQKRQLRYRQYSGDPDVLFLTFQDDDDEDDHTKNIPSSSSSVTPVKLPVERRFLNSNSCDGLVCLYSDCESCIVINPHTRWHRTLPPCNFEQRSLPYQFPMLGFGKDQINGTYKLVWLYNSRDLNSQTKATTTCEIFDFHTDSWRYVTPASPYEIIPRISSVYVDGSVHWLTKCEETKVLSFDLHTETFQVIAEAPFVDPANTCDIYMCNLNERLCVSVMKLPDQVIWLFDSGSKTLNAMYSIDLTSIPRAMLKPLAVLEEKNNKKTKLLFFEFYTGRNLLLYDLQTKSYDFIFTSNSKSIGSPACNFPSLLSI